jgi:hypothetical protein
MRRALWLLGVVVPAVASADAKHPNPFLSQAKVFATQGEGDKCLKRLLQAEQKWKYNDKKDRAEIEMYGGICGYLIGETQAAEVSFKNAVKLYPKIELPKDLGPGIEQLWAKATGKAAPIASTTTPPPAKEEKPKVAEAAPPPKKEEAPPPPQKKVDEPKPQPYAETETTTPVASEPKGRNIVLPIVFGVGAVGAGVGGLVMGLQAKSHEAQFKSLDTYYSDAQAFASQARTEALVTNILFAAAGALLIATLVAFIVG